MRRSHVLMLCSALAAPLAWSPDVRAADPPADVSARQRALFDKGVRLYDQSRWAEARAVFLEAWALKKSYAVAANLGDVELMLGDPRSAAEHLAYALRELPADEPPALRTLLTKRLAEARQLVGSLRVRVTPPGAELLIDGTPLLVEETPEEIFVDPGTHRVTARRDGYADAEKVVTVAAGTAQNLTLALAELPAVGAAKPEKLPEPAVALPVHNAREQERGPRTAVITGGVVAAGVAAGIGTVLAVVAANKWSAANDQRSKLTAEDGAYACAASQRTTTCRDAVERYDNASALWNGAIWSWIGAGTVGIGTAAYAWLAKKPPHQAGSLTVSPMFAAHGGGLVVTSTW
ncbi:PEGA domain-containing protein [Sorangium sp. So ce448]|uniref:PEGA domain-containing protein n=1 Tax=Sorangium sp. So ce448 TaxID=3133314 RepID=UPI003F60699B